MGTIDNLLQFAGSVADIEDVPEVSVGRRSFLAWAAGTTGLISTAMLPSDAYAQRRRRRPIRVRTRPYYAKIPVPDLEYNPIVKDPNFSVVELAPKSPGNHRLDAVSRIQRTERW